MKTLTIYEILLVKNLKKMKLHIQKTIDTLSATKQKDITESNKHIQHIFNQA